MSDLSELNEDRDLVIKAGGDILEKEGQIIKLQARVKELEEKADFNERWISQTCETGEIRAEKNQNIASGYAWILTVMPLPEPSE